MPILDTVAGEAYTRESVSKMKQVVDAKLIRYPVGRVRMWLSSKTLFNDSIHSGSMSPSRMIQLQQLVFTTSRAVEVSTPSVNYRVSLSM